MPPPWCVSSRKDACAGPASGDTAHLWARTSGSTDNSVPTSALRTNCSRRGSPHHETVRRPVETTLRRPSPPVYFETGGLTLSQASRGSTLRLGKAGQPRGDRNCKVLSPRPRGRLNQPVTFPPTCQHGLSRLGSSRRSSHALPTICFVSSFTGTRPWPWVPVSSGCCALCDSLAGPRQASGQAPQGALSGPRPHGKQCCR